MTRAAFFRQLATTTNNKIALGSLQLSSRSLSSCRQNHQVGRLHGKSAIVTASTEGIGFAIAKALLANGADVLVSSRKANNVEQAVSQLKAVQGDGAGNVVGTVCHVGKSEDRTKLIDTAVQAFGGLDILVSNAAVNPTFGPILDTPETSWDKIFDVNLKCSFLLARDCYPHLEKRGGNMLFVSSVGGYQPFPMIGAYSVSKTALLGLVKALAMECAPNGVRVNGIAPGVIETKFSSALTEEPVKSMMTKNIPMGRFGQADECAGTVVHLCSNEASYITGEVVQITGGMPSRL